MKRILDAIGSLFVYRSPEEREGFKRFLLTLPTRKLKILTGSKAHYSKKKFVELYFEQNKTP